MNLEQRTVLYLKHKKQSHQMSLDGTIYPS